MSQYAAAEVRYSGNVGHIVENQPVGERWTILGETFHSEAFPGPLYGPARRLALLGPLALDNVPFARFGKLLTLDRSEIEGLRDTGNTTFAAHCDEHLRAVKTHREMTTVSA